jgi:hypothetical protein
MGVETKHIPSSSVASGLPTRMLSRTEPGKMKGRCDTYVTIDLRDVRDISLYL